MIRRGIVVLLLGVGFFFCISLCLSLQAKVAQASQTAYTSIVVASPSATPTQIATPTPTSTSSSGSDANGWTSPAIAVGIVVAVIGLLGLLANTLWQQWLTSKSERKREEREELRRKEADEKAAKDEQKRLQEEQDRRVAEEEARKKALAGHVQSYREMLRQDDTVTSIKILDMTRPIEVANVYVQLKLRQDIRANPTGMLQALQKELNPNIILQVDRLRLEENYTKQAIDPVQALRDNRQCLLLGDPGAGKTTLLKYLTVQALDKQLSGLPDLPIYVELSRFAESGHESMVEFAAERWERFYGFPEVEARAYIEQQLDAGNVILLLDALDECAVGKNEDAREASYRRVFDAITQAATRYPKAYIVVTARIAGYKQRASLTAFTELEVLEFRTEDIRAFVNKWFMSPDAQKVQKGKDLNAQLENNIRIQTLAANPLLLSLTVVLYERRGRLPERRAELYKQCVEMLLYEWDKKYKGVQRFSGLSVDSKRRLLEMVAWHFHGRNERYFLNEQLLALIGKFLLDAGLKAEQQEQVLDEISADTGLLKEQAEGWYGFLHLTFQEYFVARYVADNGLLDELLTHRGEPWWEEVILLYAGSILKVKPLVEKLLAMEDDIFKTNMLLAGRCLAASAGMDQEAAPLQQQIVVQLFELLEGTSYDANKNRAAAVLAELGRTDEEIDTHLLDILSDITSTREVKKGITLALGTYGQRAFVGRLLPMLFDTNLQKITRAGITTIIGNLGDTSLIDTLLPKLQDTSTHPAIREDIVSILGRLGDRALSTQLLPLLLDDKENINVRTQIALRWYQIGDPQDAPRLAAKLLDPQMDEQTIYTIPFALAAFPNDHSVVSSLLTFASHVQGVFTRNFGFIADILGGLRNPTVTNEIVRLIADRQVALSVRTDLVASLGDAAHNSAIAELQRIYADANTEQILKEEIARTLYLLGDRTISVDTDKILRAASEVGTFEQYILEQMDVSAQLQMLADAQMSLGVRLSIASMLANSTDTSIVPSLCKFATDRVVNVKVRKAVIDTLGKIANDRATVEALVELLNSDRQVRDVVVDALWYVSRRARVRIVMDEMTRRAKVEA